jgi:hypothetical protein
LARRDSDPAACARARLEAVGLGGRWYHRPARLSGGLQQVPCALINDPRVIIADEPAVGQQAQRAEAHDPCAWAGDPRLIADDCGPAHARKKPDLFSLSSRYKPDLFSFSSRYLARSFAEEIERQRDSRNMRWSIGSKKSLSILIGWYWDAIGNRLRIKPPQQIVEVNSPPSDVARVTQAAGSPVKLLKLAPRATIREAIKAAYDAADAAGGKPPNIKELPAAVLPLLEQKGYSASARFIQELGNAPAFKVRRRTAGKTVSSERRAQQT